MSIQFKTDCLELNEKYESALAGLEKNTMFLFGFDQPVLIEGGNYRGIWLECGPLEASVYGMIRPEVAVASHRIFFKHQRDDGYIPLRVIADGVSTSQIQMVVPIAATALEVYQMVKDDQFLEEAYQACSRWDDWLATYRNTRGRGLCEAFCEFDTGHDNGPRFKGLPKRCPENDPAACPEADLLPYLASDLSATVYGGRIALSEMATILGKHEESRRWRDKAENIKRAILAYCFDPEDMCFYDLNRKDQWQRIQGDVITRVLGEHVVDQALFDEIFDRHILNPDAFWTPYPLPSIAVNDPEFIRYQPTPGWGGTSQALTALRAPRWFEHYGKPAHLTVMMKQWVKAIGRSPGFQHQVDPWTGEFSFTDEYSPTMCVYIDFISRLYGVRCTKQSIEWNCRLPEGAAESRYGIQTLGGWAELTHQSGVSVLRLSGTRLMEVTGNCRVITDLKGTLIKIVGTELESTVVHMDGEAGMLHQTISGNEKTSIVMS